MFQKKLLQLLIVWIVTLCAYSHSDPQYDNRIDLAKKLINDEKGREATCVLQPILANDPTYDAYILAGQSAAIVDDPVAANVYYYQALRIAKDKVERRVALFGFGKMQFWLDHYDCAANIYQTLLCENELSCEDYQLALAGLVKSLAYLDFPRMAYCLIPRDMAFTKIELVVAAAQASLWADWADITKCILCTYCPIIATLPQNSPLMRDLKDVQWQMDLATWPDIITPSFFFSLDTEQFNIREYTLDYSHYWCQPFVTSLGLLQSNYSQHSQELVGKGFYVGQLWRATRDLTINARIRPTFFNNWHPVLWKGNVLLRANDYVWLNVLASREVITSMTALQQHIHNTQFSGDLTFHPWPYVRMNGSLYRLNISDSNRRYGYYFSLQGLLFPTYGISLIGQQREYTDKFQSPFYFSPDRYRQRAFLVRFSSKAGAIWHYYVDAGIGRQWIIPTVLSPSSSSPTHQWGAGINGPINKNVFIRAYYANIFQASAFNNSPSYRYQYGGIELNLLV